VVEGEGEGKKNTRKGNKDSIAVAAPPPKNSATDRLFLDSDTSEDEGSIKIDALPPKHFAQATNSPHVSGTHIQYQMATAIPNVATAAVGEGKKNTPEGDKDSIAGGMSDAPLFSLSALAAAPPKNSTTDHLFLDSDTSKDEGSVKINALPPKHFAQATKSPHVSGTPIQYQMAMAIPNVATAAVGEGEGKKNTPEGDKDSIAGGTSDAPIQYQMAMAIPNVEMAPVGEGEGKKNTPEGDKDSIAGGTSTAPLFSLSAPAAAPPKNSATEADIIGDQ
jgi:hypothetical protein